MENTGLWKYCTPKQTREFLLSFRLFGETEWGADKQLACLYAVSNHIDRHYRVSYIPKRDGGTRRLQVPDHILKKIQRNILHHILEQMPVSDSATAYRKGVGILANVRVHTEAGQILKLDIKDFFGNILFYHVYRYAFPSIYFPPSVGTLLTNLCCYRDCLPQGAPTSAAISNLVMKSFDRYMCAWCEERGIRYTRYCDDMTFSGDFDSGVVIRKVNGFLKSMGFELNREKLKVATCHHRQEVTGIVVNEKPQAAKDYRRRLRQELYYCERFGMQSHLESIHDTRFLPFGEAGLLKYRMSLLGRINYILYLNPEDSYFLYARRRLLEMKIM